MKKLTDLAAWRALATHQKEFKPTDLNDLFRRDPQRATRYTLQATDIALDYSRNFITDQTCHLLTQLVDELKLSLKINRLFNGEPINGSENRPALHTALRRPQTPPLVVDGKNISDLIADAQNQLFNFVDKVHRDELTGATGKPFAHIVTIGIGGSYLGPLLGVQALKDFEVTPLTFHFISSVDRAHLDDIWKHIDPETTLFIISSKSFATIETLTNAKTILARMQALFGDKAFNHFAAVTAHVNKAHSFGIKEHAIFPIWEWVGGRYSIWSAIGLPLILMIGKQHFHAFLAGAHEMDLHFQQAEFSSNMPVLLALLSIWYTNFFDASAQAIVPYAYRLRHLVPYLQQANMESNGKRVDQAGNPLSYATGPVIFGEEGCNGQHTYHQLLHQGQRLIPVDFILVKNTTSALDDHQAILLASGLSQAQALMQGKSHEEAMQALIAQQYSPAEAQSLAAHQMIPGNRPSNIISIDRITPHSLGALIALYEHKIFVESVIWDINPFDQWGVELGKQLLPDILKCVRKSHSVHE